MSAPSSSDASSMLESSRVTDLLLMHAIYIHGIQNLPQICHRLKQHPMIVENSNQLEALKDLESCKSRIHTILSEAKKPKEAINDTESMLEICGTLLKQAHMEISTKISSLMREMQAASSVNEAEESISPMESDAEAPSESSKNSEETHDLVPDTNDEDHEEMDVETIDDVNTISENNATIASPIKTEQTTETEIAKAKEVSTKDSEEINEQQQSTNLTSNIAHTTKAETSHKLSSKSSLQPYEIPKDIRNFPKDAHTENPNIATTAKPRKTTRASSVPSGQTTQYSAHSSLEQPRKTAASLLQLLQNISMHRFGNTFAQPVTKREAPEYESVVHFPQDFRTLRNQIKNEEIKTTEEFLREILRIFANAIMFNPEDSPVALWAKECYEHAEHEMEQFKNIKI